MDFLRTTFRQIVCATVIYAALGVFLLAQPDTPFAILGKVIGVVMLVMGLLKTILYFAGKQYEGEQRNDMTIGIVVVVIGVFMLLKADVTSEIVGYILGFMILVSAVLQFQYAIDLHHFGDEHTVLSVGMGVIGLLFGVIALINPFQTEKHFIYLIGAGMLASAVCNLVSGVLFGICIQRKQKKPEEKAKDLLTPVEKEDDVL